MWALRSAWTWPRCCAKPIYLASGGRFKFSPRLPRLTWRPDERYVGVVEVFYTRLTFHDTSSGRLVSRSVLDANNLMDFSQLGRRSRKSFTWHKTCFQHHPAGGDVPA